MRPNVCIKIATREREAQTDRKKTLTFSSRKYSFELDKEMLGFTDGACETSIVIQPAVAASSTSPGQIELEGIASSDLGSEFGSLDFVIQKK